MGEAEDEGERLQWRLIRQSSSSCIISSDYFHLTRTSDHSIPPPSPQVTKVGDLFQRSISSGGVLGGLQIDAKKYQHHTSVSSGTEIRASTIVNSVDVRTATIQGFMYETS